MVASGGDDRGMVVTISDVAAHAGVGAGTVSRVLNDSPQVSVDHPGSGARRHRDRSTIAPTRWPGASPSAAARRSASSSRSSPTPQPIERLRGVVDALDGSRYDLVLFNVESPVHRDEHFAALDRPRPSRRSARHVLAAGSSRPRAPARDAGVPVVLVDARGDGVPCVVTDDVEGGRMATRHLVDAGPPSGSGSSATIRTTRSASPSSDERETRLRRRARRRRASTGRRDLVRHGPHDRDRRPRPRRELLALTRRRRRRSSHHPTCKPPASSRRPARRPPRARRPVGRRVRRHRGLRATWASRRSASRCSTAG